MRLRARVPVGLLACLPVGLFFGCAPKGPSPVLVADAAKARALVQQGCYTCLKEALALYDKQSSAKVPVPGSAEGRFDAALLLAIREKQLGIPGDESMANALRLVPVAPSARPPVALDQPVSLSRQVVYDAAQLIIGDTTSLDPDQRAAVTGRTRPALEPDHPKRRALDAALENDFAARYVALSIDCEQQKLIERVDIKALTALYAGVPLLQFRLSTCGRPPAPNSGALREGDPRWTDTLYWEGRRELTSSIG